VLARRPAIGFAVIAAVASPVLAIRYMAKQPASLKTPETAIVGGYRVDGDLNCLTALFLAGLVLFIGAIACLIRRATGVVAVLPFVSLVVVGAYYSHTLAKIEEVPAFRHAFDASRGALDALANTIESGKQIQVPCQAVSSRSRSGKSCPTVQSFSTLKDRARPPRAGVSCAHPVLLRTTCPHQNWVHRTRRALTRTQQVD
jgi:hypothetical protein